MNGFKLIIRIYFFFGGITVACLYSCKQFVSVPLPANQIVTSQVFSNDQTALSAMVGVYSKAMSFSTPSLLNSGGILLGLSADEINNTTPDDDFDGFRTNSILPGNFRLSTGLWSQPYQTIYECNAIIEGVQASSAVSSQVKRQLLGECYFMRALTYYYLTSLFEKVPLVLSTDYIVNQSLPQSTQTDIYVQIKKDLTSSITLLSESYVTTGRVRPNKWAATALLARIYLCTGDYNNAITSAAAVINAGVYSLPADLNTVFLSSSNEAIFQMLPVKASLNTAEGQAYIPASTTVIPKYAVSSFLVSAFESNDLRKVSWLKNNTVNGTAYWYPYKYKVRSGANVTEYNMVLRLAEQYLIRAEANAMQGNVVNAITDLNKVRARAGLSAINNNISKDSCLASIMKENRVEFFCEWGHRWLDLKRTNQVDAILGVEKPGWNSTAVLYPIPQQELMNNPFLKQNTGY